MMLVSSQERACTHLVSSLTKKTVSGNLLRAQVLAEGKMYTFYVLYNDHSWDPRIVAAIDRQSLFRARLGPQNDSHHGPWSLFGGVCQLKFVNLKMVDEIGMVQISEVPQMCWRFSTYNRPTGNQLLEVLFSPIYFLRQCSQNLAHFILKKLLYAT